MNNFFSNLLNVCIIIYLNNILIYSNNMSKYYWHVKKVFKHLCKTSLCAKAKKYELYSKLVKDGSILALTDNIVPSLYVM